MNSPTQTNMAIILTKTDDFNAYFTEQYENSKFAEIYACYQTLKFPEPIEIPNVIFDILYSSLIPVFNGENSSIEVNLSLLNRRIYDNYRAVSMHENPLIEFDAQIELKKELDIVLGRDMKESEHHLMSDLLTETVNISWQAYREFMPIEKYGPPAKNIIEWLINNVINLQYGTELDFPFESYPYVMKTNDPYGILKDFEINYLRNLLAEHGINVDDQMLVDGYIFLQMQLEAGLKKEPLNLIVSPASIKIGTFRDPEINAQLSSGIKSFLNDVAENVPENEYKTQIKLVNTYCDYFINHKTSFDEIDRVLGKEIEEAENCLESSRTTRQEDLLSTQKEVSIKSNARENIKTMLKNAGMEFELITDKPPEMKRRRGRPPKK